MSKLDSTLFMSYTPTDSSPSNSAKLALPENETATANFSGPFRLFSSAGEDVTPSSTLRQAILAVLISSPGQIRGRKSLQEMFWGGVDPERAAGRFRTALSQLRKDLAFLGADTLRADRRVVSLAPNRISMELRYGSGQDPLEGIDLPLANADSFEDWLRDFRTSEFANADQLCNHVVKKPSRSDMKISIGLMDVQYCELDEVKLFRAERFVYSIVLHLSQLSQLAIHDLRGSPERRKNLPKGHQSSSTVLLHPVLRSSGERFDLTLQLFNAMTQEILWVSRIIDLNVEDADRAGSYVAEQILDRIMSIGHSDCPADLLPWATLTALFSMDPDVIIDTEEQLSLICSDDDRGIVKPLQVFAQIFRENEGLAEKQEIDPSWLINVLDKINQSDSLRALSESLVGYSAHMLSNDNELGSMLVEQSYLRAPNIALNLDHLAVIRLARDDIVGASKVFHKCKIISGLSPWRYSFDVTGAMISLAQGDVSASLKHANTALMRKPKFVGALRYAMVGFAMAGKPREAHLMKTQIQQLRPNYDFSIWLESVLRRSAPQFSKTIIQSFERNELI